MTTATATAARRRSLAYRLYHGETAYDFVGRRGIWFLISAVIIVIGIVAVVVRGLNFGIDFRGGTSWEMKAPGVSVADVRSAVAAEGVTGATVQKVGSNFIRVTAEVKGTGGAANRPLEQKVTGRLAQLAHTSTTAVSVNDVGPSWGSEISSKAWRALGFFLLAIVLYLSVRFEPKMALAAILAVLHDIMVTVGVYALFGLQVTPDTVIALLTILGYSLYDTVVVFDKIQENTRGLASTGRLTYTDTVNLSMNQVLMRSVNTTLVAIMPIVSILIVGSYFLGAATLQNFGLALFIGLMSGAYSSIFIASPLLAIFKEREPRYAAIRNRLAGRGGQAGLLTPAAAARGTGGGASPAAVGEVPAGPRGGEPRSGGPRPSPARPGARRPAPRPRKKGRRR